MPTLIILITLQGVVWRQCAFICDHGLVFVDLKFTYKISLTYKMALGQFILQLIMISSLQSDLVLYVSCFVFLVLISDH